jgi:hypothetical protein
MTDLTTTNTWLAILAVVSLAEFLMVCIAGGFAYRLYTKVMTTIDTVERVHIAPLHARADSVLDEVERITGRVKHAQDTVSEVFQQMAGTGSAVAWAMKARTWPIIGVLQGLKSAAATVMGNGRKTDADRSYGAM